MIVKICEECGHALPPEQDLTVQAIVDAINALHVAVRIARNQELAHQTFLDLVNEVWKAHEAGEVADDVG